MGGERGGCRLVGVSGLMTHRETKPTLLGVHEKYNFIPPCELFLSFFCHSCDFYSWTHSTDHHTVLEAGGDCGFEC